MPQRFNAPNTVLDGRNAVCKAHSFNGHNTAKQLEILFQWQKYCFSGKNTVLVATVELPQLTVSLFPRLDGRTAGVSPPGKWRLLLALLQSIACASIAKYYQQHLHIISNQQIELN